MYMVVVCDVCCMWKCGRVYIYIMKQSITGANVSVWWLRGHIHLCALVYQCIQNGGYNLQEYVHVSVITQGKYNTLMVIVTT